MFIIQAYLAAIQRHRGRCPPPLRRGDLTGSRPIGALHPEDGGDHGELEELEQGVIRVSKGWLDRICAKSSEVRTAT